jgi:hypothetical protein
MLRYIRILILIAIILKPKSRSFTVFFIFINNSRVYLIYQTAKEFLVAKDNALKSFNNL